VCRSRNKASIVNQAVEHVELRLDPKEGKKTKMAVEVLQSRAEINEAREELRRRQLSFTSPRWKHLAHSLRIIHDIEVGDFLKSWDVLKTLEFLERNLPKDATILDIGAFASEIPCILHSLGYMNLAGVDLNPDIKKMPYADAVRYEVADFLRTPFADASFQAITAISVIEHGFKGNRLLTEVSRLLRSSGYFIASFDFWPDKVNSEDVRLFGMDWTIFSAQEVRAFIAQAAEHKLFPSGSVALRGQDKPIRFAKREYTFAWLALQKA
jgi:SAM-dependent methyltransferase